VMVFAAFGMAISIFIGSAVGHPIWSIVAATLVAFASGLLVAWVLRPRSSACNRSWQSCGGGFRLIRRRGHPRGDRPRRRAGPDTSVVLIWPPPILGERQTIAAYAAWPAGASYGGRRRIAPEPHTLRPCRPLSMIRTLCPCGRRLSFQALFDEAERIRASPRASHRTTADGANAVLRSLFLSYAPRAH
jgi:hypothetical protein